MNSERIKEIQAETAYPQSRSVHQALLKVWNECEQKQERMYSEEEVEDLIYKVCGTVARLQGITLNGNHIDTAYKQFKNK